MRQLVILAIICGAAGCTSIDKLPAGAQLQSSTFGVKVSPQAVDGTPLAIGSHTTIVTTAQPPDGGPNVNRFEGAAPLVRMKSTVATGPVGDELEKAGGADAIRALVEPIGPSIPVPRTDAEGWQPADEQEE